MGTPGAGQFRAREGEREDRTCNSHNLAPTAWPVRRDSSPALAVAHQPSTRLAPAQRLQRGHEAIYHPAATIFAVPQARCQGQHSICGRCARGLSTVPPAAIAASGQCRRAMGKPLTASCCREGGHQNPPWSHVTAGVAEQSKQAPCDTGTMAKGERGEANTRHLRTARAFVLAGFWSGEREKRRVGIEADGRTPCGNNRPRGQQSGHVRDVGMESERSETRPARAASFHDIFAASWRTRWEREMQYIGMQLAISCLHYALPPVYVSSPNPSPQNLMPLFFPLQTL